VRNLVVWYCFPIFSCPQIEKFKLHVLFASCQTSIFSRIDIACRRFNPPTLCVFSLIWGGLDYLEMEQLSWKYTLSLFFPTSPFCSTNKCRNTAPPTEQLL
jgi:hypothetical protein